MQTARLFLSLLCLCVPLLSGCASKWVINDQPLEGQVQWPRPPEIARVQHVRTIVGFNETGTSLKTVIFGKGEEKFIRPIAAATGTDGRIAIADSGCKCVHLYVPSGEHYYKLFTFDHGEMVSPVGVVFDNEQRLYVSDSVLGRILVFDKEGEYLSSIDKTSESALKRPTGLSFNPVMKVVYVVDTLENKVHAFDPAGNAVLSFGERGTEKGRFNYPTHIFWAGDRIYVTDALNFRVQIFDLSGNFISSFGRHGDGSGDFAMPKGIAVDKTGTIYVVDNLFDNIQLFNDHGEFLLTIGGRGTGQGEFWLPSGIFIDANDKLYLCDTFNQRIQVFQLLGGPH